MTFVEFCVCTFVDLWIFGIMELLKCEIVDLLILELRCYALMEFSICGIDLFYRIFETVKF